MNREGNNFGELELKVIRALAKGDIGITDVPPHIMAKLIAQGIVVEVPAKAISDAIGGAVEFVGSEITAHTNGEQTTAFSGGTDIPASIRNFNIQSQLRFIQSTFGVGGGGGITVLPGGGGTGTIGEFPGRPDTRCQLPCFR